MRINWFSPLPPAKSGIADYSEHLLPVLSSAADVVLWTDQPDWDLRIETYGEVCYYNPNHVDWRKLNQADATFYHIGNHPGFHGSIWDISRQCSGIVVLHDVYLQHFFKILLSETKSAGSYLTEMWRLYGDRGFKAARSVLDGRSSLEDLASDFPLTPLAVENALGVVVHTREGFEMLSTEITAPLGYTPLPYASHDRVVSPVTRKRPPYHLIIFGHFGGNRRIESILEALAGLPDRKLFHLNIYGTLPDNRHSLFEGLIPGLEDTVTLHGFVERPQLERALASADLALNLRYPSMGEASFSQLQIFDHGLPSLVTQTGWYASLPQDVVAFVRPDREVADIQDHLLAFAANPGKFRIMGERALGFLRAHHSPSAYVATLMRLIQMASETRHRTTARCMALKSAAESRIWLTSRQTDAMFKRIANEILKLTRADQDSQKKVSHRQAGG